MLELTVDTRHSGVVRLEFEHSLLSLSKWEDKTGKAFLSNSQKSPEEMLTYYQLMLTSPEQDPDLVLALNSEQHKELTNYINSTPGATSFPPKVSGTKGSTEVLTAEIIYSQMTMLRIPWEAKYWHVNKLLVTIAWIAYKQTPDDKKKDRKSVRERLADWNTINEANRKRFNSNG